MTEEAASDEPIIEQTYIPYVSLHNHTDFSIMDSLIKPADLFKKAKEFGQPAVAITDHGTLAGMWDALKESKKYGVKLIAGCEFYFTDDLSDKEGRLRHVILLAKNAIGYRNLLIISKLGYDNSIITFKKVIPRIDWDILEKYSEGLICTTACGNGILAQLVNNKLTDEAKLQAVRLKNIFKDDFAIEIQAHALRRNANLYSDYVEQTFTNRKLIEIAEELDVKIIVTTNAHYVNKEDHRAHDVWLAMGSGQPVESNNRLRYNVNDFYIKTGNEIFDKLARNKGEDFAKKVIENTLYFANKCENPDWIDPKFSNPSGKELPEYPVKFEADYKEFLEWRQVDGEKYSALSEDMAYLRFWCYKELEKYNYSNEEKAKRLERLEEEFDVFEFQSFSSYMLIVADFVRFSRDNGIKVGPGRGSVGGSYVGYLLGIHISDPFKYGLVFARFYNKDKKSPPDIDLDFAPSGREKVIDYVRNKYGEEFVARVGNINTLTPKPYVKSIARTFMYGGDRKEAVAIGAKLADTIPSPTYSGIRTIKAALEKAPLFAEYAESKYPELKEFANLGGHAVAWATHAAGFIVGKRSLVGLVPLRRDKEGNVAVEYEKERAEDNGLVKIDFLGLETLDIISKTHELILINGKTPPPQPFNYEGYDEKTYDLISSGNTFCVFQLGESSGTIELCKNIKPKSINDLADINALARPSARDIREKFIKAKNGEAKFSLLHPLLERAFKATYGFGLYEECLMYLAQDFAGWSMLEADRLRKLTKDKGKYPEKVKKWRAEFIESAETKNNVDKKIATKVWDDIIAKYGGYAFNLSHAVLYSLTSYETAYLKAHYPLEFLVANLMFEVYKSSPMSKDKIAKMKKEIKGLNVNIKPPDINLSEMSYKIINENTLMTGLDALKFIGTDAIPEILAKRPFSSFEDFLSRCDSKKVRAPAVQALAASGCLDSISDGLTRKQMFLYASDYKKKLQVHLKKKKAESFHYPWPQDGEWTIPEINALEQKYIGEGLTGSKMNVYEGFFSSIALNFSEFKKKYPEATKEEIKRNKSKYKVFPVEGIIRGIFEFTVKKEDSSLCGQTMARITLEDPYDNQIEMVCFPDGLEHFKKRLKDLSKPNKPVILEVGAGLKISGSISWYEGDISLIFEELIQCCPPPPLPADLKAKKITTQSSRSRNKKNEVNEQELLIDIEEELIEEGFADDEDWN